MFSQAPDTDLQTLPEGLPRQGRAWDSLLSTSDLLVHGPGRPRVRPPRQKGSGGRDLWAKGPLRHAPVRLGREPRAAPVSAAPLLRRLPSPASIVRVTRHARGSCRRTGAQGLRALDGPTPRGSDSRGRTQPVPRRPEGVAGKKTTASAPSPPFGHSPPDPRLPGGPVAARDGPRLGERSWSPRASAAGSPGAPSGRRGSAHSRNRDRTLHVCGRGRVRGPRGRVFRVSTPGWRGMGVLRAATQAQPR